MGFLLDVFLFMLALPFIMAALFIFIWALFVFGVTGTFGFILFMNERAKEKAREASDLLAPLKYLKYDSKEDSDSRKGDRHPVFSEISDGSELRTYDDDEMQDDPLGNNCVGMDADGNYDLNIGGGYGMDEDGNIDPSCGGPGRV